MNYEEVVSREDFLNLILQLEDHQEILKLPQIHLRWAEYFHDPHLWKEALKRKYNVETSAEESPKALYLKRIMVEQIIKREESIVLESPDPEVLTRYGIMSSSIDLYLQFQEPPGIIALTSQDRAYRYRRSKKELMNLLLDSDLLRTRNSQKVPFPDYLYNS